MANGCRYQVVDAGDGGSCCLWLAAGGRWLLVEEMVAAVACGWLGREQVIKDWASNLNAQLCVRLLPMYSCFAAAKLIILCCCVCI